MSAKGEKWKSTLTWRTVWPIISPWRWMLAVAILSVIAGAGLALLPPLILRRLIDTNLALGRVEGIFVLGLGYLGATAAVHVTNFITSYITSVAAQRALRRLRVRLFAHVQSLPISYFDTTPIGDTISRCTSDMETIDRLFSSGVISLLAQTMQVFVTFAAMLALSLPLSLSMVVVIPVLVIISRRFQLLMRDAQRVLRKAIGTLTSRMQEYLTRTEVIRAFNWNFRIVQSFRRVLKETLMAQNRSIAYGAFYDPLLKILQAALVAVLLILSGAPILTGFRVSIGTLTAFIFLFDRFFQPLITIGNEWQVVQGAFAGLERIFEVLLLGSDAGGIDPASRSSQAPTSDDGLLIALQDVSFGYLPGQPVLTDISLQVTPGRHVAIVGRTGAGKSTLIHLLGGLYRPWEGAILVAGHNPHSMSADERRRILGIVPQNPWLYSGTVADNLSFGDSAISRDATEKAARISGAHAFIKTLPAGYDTLISDAGHGQGTQVSAGQRQLLALTRALVGDPSILLLDEATSSIDNATEAAFKDALRIQMEDRCGAVITVAHRISTAMTADRIVVIESGRIVETGSPSELIRTGGHFASLYELENAGWDWRVIDRE
jgi:ATP-binding cassette, subfamily B, multidrug efflux pump